MQTSVYQANRHQLLLMGSTIFVSVTAAVIVSTLLVMSLMRGEIASALTPAVQNSTPVSQVASTCVAPEEDQKDQPASASTVTTSTPVTQNAGAPLNYSYSAHYVPAAQSVKNSYNNTNISHVKTINKINNTELHKTTVIKDSFNKNSYNDNSSNPIIIKDNEVNVNSGNTTITDNSTETTNVTKDSNNTVNSNNFEKHVFSDNKVIVPVVPLVAPIPTL